MTMTIDPPYVENGKHVSLGCHYKLEGEPLYSVKWYRGTFEFYRYSPSENPPKKIFTYPGFYVDVSFNLFCYYIDFERFNYLKLPAIVFSNNIHTYILKSFYFKTNFHSFYFLLYTINYDFFLSTYAFPSNHDVWYSLQQSRFLPMV